jgi:FPC/CPF motif-containing protein YcgG
MYSQSTCPHVSQRGTPHIPPSPRPWNPLYGAGAAFLGEAGDDARSEATEAAHRAFIDYVGGPGFPCVGARSAMNKARYRFELFGGLGDDDSAQPVCSALYEFLHAFQNVGTNPVTFVAAFSSSAASEASFQAGLWRQLQSMHAVDREFFGWDPRVSSDPASSEFSFSIGGRGLFVVGLHAKSSRLARRAPADTLIFNLHEQFEELRTTGKYEGMQRVVRQRDLALQGSINPVLARFGEASEAMQYAGNAVPAAWQCPFKAGVAA